ncbi:gliding motility-associated C-terminal domain-containing protein [Aquimarina sp. 2201CG1-2-11]|uniref:T9SS type B sorting domain-containing protein n=1 Tax=Aquimarina discodermiae TaxID=3231043 RepID=UPI0034627590
MKRNYPFSFIPIFLFFLFFAGITSHAQNYSGITITGVQSGNGTGTAVFTATSVDNPNIAFVRTTRISGAAGNWTFLSPDNIRWSNTATGSAVTLFEFLDSGLNPVQDDYRLTFNDLDGPNNEAVEYTCDSNFRFVTGDPDVNITPTPSGILATGTIGGAAGSVMFEIKDTGTFNLILTGNSGFVKNIDFNFTEFTLSPPFLYDICAGDTDGDTVNDDSDFDDDNDGILDVDEANGNNPDGDADGDGLPNFQDIEDNAGQPGIPAGDGSTTDYTDANGDGIPDVYDTDGDSIPNHLDLDSDNDGIPDNVEAQSTVGYVAPSATVDGNGVPDNYGGGFSTLQNSDALLTVSDAVPDYLDNDSDNDGFSDTFEAGITLTGTDSDKDGLDNVSDTTGDYSDANGNVDVPSSLPDADGNVFSGGDVDFRDTLDSDGDNILDIDDDDDDNDGITDVVENLGNDPFGDADGDGVINFADNFDNGTSGDGSTTDYTDTNNNGVPDVYDIDGDGIANHLDIDADGDNCNDVIEAGFTPSGTRPGELQGTGFSSSGLVTGGTDGYTTPDSAYVNNGPDTDSDGIANTCDTDDDNDGNPDTTDPNPTGADAENDLLTVVEGTTNDVNILTNDDFVPGATTLITRTGGNAGGTVTFDPLTGIMNYTPAPGEEGSTVTVVYQVCNDVNADSPGNTTDDVCEDATVNITVQTDTDDDGNPDVTDTDDDNDGNPDTTDPNPLVPTTMDDNLTVVEGTTNDVNILTNDDFVPGATTLITRTGGNAGGTVTFDPLTGIMNYTPAPGEEGSTVTVVYQVCNDVNADSPGNTTDDVCEDATVNITVQTDTDDDGNPDVTDTDDDNDGNPDTTDPNPLVPTTMDDNLTVVEGTTNGVNILTNDDFLPGANTLITRTGGNAGGTVTFDPLTGVMNYTPLAGEEGSTVTVVYQVCNDVNADSPGNTTDDVCEDATVNITVQTDTDDDGTPDVTDTDDDDDGNPDTTDPNPLVPTTMDDNLTVVEGTTNGVNILTNDDFLPGANTLITRTSGNAGGTVTFDPLTGVMNYTPLAGEEGSTVTVVYQVCNDVNADSPGNTTDDVCEDATVNITVQTDTDDDGTPDVTDTDDDNDGNPDTTDPNPLVPTTMDDNLTVVEGTTNGLNILTNDDFLPGANHLITRTGGNAGGTVTFDPLTGVMNYTPAPGEEGSTVTVVYQVCNDVNADSPGNTTDDVCEDATVNITVQTDTDDDGTPDVTDTDDDNDGNPDTTDPNPLVPTTMDDNLTVVEGTTNGVNILTNDDFLPGANTLITRTGGNAGGTVTFDPLTGIMNYTPAPGEEGSTVTVVYQVCNDVNADSPGNTTDDVCEDATVNITVQTDTDDDGTPDVTDTDDDNDGNPDTTDPNPLVPTTMDDNLTVVEGTTNGVNILTNDDFLPGANTLITRTGGNAGGTVTFDPLTGIMNYTPAPGEEGSTVTVVYQVCNDVNGDSPGNTTDDVCEDATVNITVQTDTDDDGTPDVTDTDDDNDGNPDTTDPNPLVPTTMDDNLTVVEGTTNGVNILTNDDFLPGANTLITRTGGNAGGTVTFDPLTGIMNYTPAPGEEGSTVTVVYQVCNDVNGDSPVTTSDDVCEDATVNITVQTDTDDDGTPDVTDTDDDNDGNPDTTDPNPLVPTTMDDNLTVVEGTTNGVNILTNDDFLPGANTLITRTGGNAGGTVTFDPLTGVMNYTPLAGEEGSTVTVVYQVCNDVNADSPGNTTDDVCEDATVNITVQTDTDDDGTPDVTDTDDDNDGNPDTTDPNPQIPVANDDVQIVTAGILGTIDVLTNDDFLPGINTSLTNTGLGTATGVISFDPLTGDLSYTATAAESGTIVTVVYQVCNTAVTPNVCENATVNITVIGDDSDNDGIPDPIDLDDDNDGIPDTVEQGGNPTLDTDGDGIIDSLDLDSDGDGVLDVIESGGNGLDVNNDGQVDGPYGTDGIADSIQNTPDDGMINYTLMDSDEDGTSDFQDIDDDGDGVYTINEDVNIDGSPVGDDSDEDGIPNYLDTDDDGDGISTEEENPNNDADGDPFTGDTQDTDGDGIADYLDTDDDGDGVNTIEEDVNDDNNPLNDDTDADGVPDYLDTDDDGDGILTIDETPDPNGDGNPDDAFDSDGDGTPDYLEPNDFDTNSEDDLEVFNVVTPNGDGDHDIFIIRNIENFPANELKIFNRWGVLVYEALGYGRNGEYFSGESNGRATINKDRLLPVGTYFYVLTYKTSSGETKKRSDYLYINR